MKTVAAVDVVAVFDETIVAVKRCEHRPRVARALASSILDDRRVLPYLAGSLVAHFVILALLVLAPGDGGGIDTELGALDATSTSSELALPLPVQTGPDDSSDREAPGLRLADGASEPTRERADTPIMRARITRDAAIADAREAGILGSTALRADGFRRLTGSVDLSTGFDDTVVLGGAYAGHHDAGEFGFGRSGFGPGCDDRCEGNGTIGAGRYGTIGHGRGAGDGYGWAGGRGLLFDGTARVPMVTICGYRPDGTSCAVSDHGLDKAIIRRYVRRHLDEIRYCYEKELLATPGLTGTVVTEFVINPDGSVASATAHGMHDAIDSCVAGVIAGIAFPAAQTHMATSVKYPFDLRTP